MDSTNLVEMLDNIQEQGYPIHGIVIVRNGYLVLDAYFHPFRAESRHIMYSATKSFLSALIGIAIRQGYIDGINHNMLDYFSDRAIANVDQRKQAITLEHLLTMSYGLNWPTHNGFDDLWDQFTQSKDWVQFVLDRPMLEEPGNRFNYNSGSPHLLSAVIQQTTGMSALDFAHKNLFGPLGVANVSWAFDPNGINLGFTGMALPLHDAAKFGYLYLNNGAWDGQPIVSAEWVKASSASHIDMGGLGYHYGYLWWVDPSDIYKASGSNGQRIFVIPEQNMVVVFAGGSGGLDDGHVPEKLLTSYILAAAKSTEPLPANPVQTAALEARVHALANPEPKPIEPLPAIARSVSGKTYTLPANVLGVGSFTLNIAENGQASIEVSRESGSQKFPIGLDDVYRFAQLNQKGVQPSVIALKGSWPGKDTFALSIFQEGNTTDVRLVFNDGGVQVNIHNPSGSQTVSGKLKAHYPSPSSTVSTGQHPYSSRVQIVTANHITQTAEVNYLLYLPAAYRKDPQQKWPLILFLHGRGERGDDLELLKKHPLPKILEEQTDFPFIVASPQHSLEGYSWSDMIDPLNALLDQLQATYAVDPKRVYLTGLSMGGYGAWSLALRYPGRFAAVVPIAGGYEGSLAVPDNICDLRNVPIWVFHGGNDTIVPPAASEVLVEALKACEGNVKFTLYPDADHEGSFVQAYADPELYRWLSKQTLR